MLYMFLRGALKFFMTHRLRAIYARAETGGVR